MSPATGAPPGSPSPDGAAAPSEGAPSPERARRPPASAQIHSATLLCENCGRETEHRILRVDRGTGASSGRSISGIARCRECRWTHPFRSAEPPTVEIRVIVSSGPRSRASNRRLPARTRIEVGASVPGDDDRARVVRIDRTGGRSVRAARAADIVSIWAVEDAGPRVPVSLIVGNRTRGLRIPSTPDRTFSIGDEVEVDRLRARVVALRGLGRTWKVPGDSLRAPDVQRLYARPIAMPPAGRSDWRRGRDSPSDVESSTSSSARRASSPGVRRKRAVPRPSNARGGATVHSSSPS